MHVCISMSVEILFFVRLFVDLVARDFDREQLELEDSRFPVQ